MRGVSEFVLVLLFIIIVLFSITVLWLYYYGYFRHITFSGESPSLGEALSSCMKIDSVRDKRVYLMNCGSGVIKNNKINVYFDDDVVSFSMNPETIKKGEVGIIDIYNLSLWDKQIGENHKIKIASSAGETERYVKTALPDSCVLALDFDEDSGTIAYDSSEYGNDGTLLPVGSEPQWVNGKFGKALEFDGIDDFVNVLNSESLELTNQFTVSAWFKSARDLINPPEGSGYYGGVGKKSGGSVDYGIFWCGGTDGWKVEFYDTGGGRHHMNITGGFPVYANNWYHVVGTYNGTHLKIYVDGVERNVQNEGAFTIRTSGEPFEVGHYKTAPKPYWNGTIDSVRVCNGPLTPDETISLTLGELS